MNGRIPNRIAIDAWDPGYGTGAADPTALVPSDVPTDTDVEVPLRDWRPRRPSGAAWDAVIFLDGVQRIDARAWVTGDDGRTRQGLCASVAAGAVRCDGVAEVLDVLVDRILATPAEGADHLVTRHGTWRHTSVADEEIEVLERAVARTRAEAEASLATRIAAGGEQLVVDGPLSQHRHLGGALGYVKTLQRGYGPPDVLRVASILEAGERTPVFMVGESVARWSWYVRLPGPLVHPLAGVVRCEAGDRSAQVERDRPRRSLSVFVASLRFCCAQGQPGAAEPVSDRGARADLARSPRRPGPLAAGVAISRRHRCLRSRRTSRSRARTAAREALATSRTRRRQERSDARSRARTAAREALATSRTRRRQERSDARAERGHGEGSASRVLKTGVWAGSWWAFWLLGSLRGGVLGLVVVSSVAFAWGCRASAAVGGRFRRLRCRGR